MCPCSALTIVRDTWIMFNDFVVREVSEEEVFSFPDTWKVRYLPLVKLTSDSGNCHTRKGRLRNGTRFGEITYRTQPRGTLQRRITSMESSDALGQAYPAHSRRASSAWYIDCDRCRVCRITTRRNGIQVGRYKERPPPITYVFGEGVGTARE
jgi:hypothetical protein